MADSYPDRTNASGLWNVNEISKNKTTGGNWPGNFGTPGGRGLFACGQTPSSVDTVDFITISTAGDATDFGNLQSADRHGCNGSGSTTRGLFCGGGSNTNIEDTIDFFTIASTGNATDFGNLTRTDANIAGIASFTRGFFCGGDEPSGYSDVIDYVTIVTTGNASDFGDLTTSRGAFAAVSN